MTEAETAKASAKARATAAPQGRNARTGAANARHGMDEMRRSAEAHEADAHEDDERDGQDERDMSDEEYLALFRDSINQSVLPDLPEITGFHTFWATTTNSRDTVQNRLRMGYTFIKSSDFPGWDAASIKTGEYAGVIGQNEMIAMKIPNRRYQLYMQEVHHRQPLAEESKIAAMVDNLRENAARDKGRITDIGDGTDAIVQKAPVPVFA